MAVTYRSSVSIAEIIVYVPCLVIAIVLATRHSFRHASGWIYLAMFALARLIGASMQLATISHPNDISLYFGAATVTNIGLSPLLLATIGLLRHVFDSTRYDRSTPVQASIRIFLTILAVALILGIVGGVQAGRDYSNSGRYTPSILSKVSSVLYTIGYAIIVAMVAVAYFKISHIGAGEKRLLFAILASLPFLLVRLVYSLLVTFGHNKNFNVVTGSVTAVLCVAFVEEFIVTVIYEAAGLLLSETANEMQPYTASTHRSADRADSIHSIAGAAPRNGTSKSQSSRIGQTILGIGKKTIIARIIISAVGSRSDDVEMQRNGFDRK